MDKKKITLLRQKRIAKNYTQKELGDMLGGVYPQTIQNWEYSLRLPSTPYIMQLKVVLELTDDDILEIIAEYEENKKNRL